MNTTRLLFKLLRGMLMAKRRTMTRSTKVRGPRRRRPGPAKEFLRECYKGEQLSILRSVGDARYELVKTKEGQVIRVTKSSLDRAAHLETSFEPPIGGPLNLVEVAVRVRGRRSATNSATALEIAVETDGQPGEWQSIALTGQLTDEERIFTFNGDGRFESSSIKLRPSTDGQSAVIEQIEIKAIGRPL